MSRREDRSSELKRYRSRFGREPSPKRSRRDDRADAEGLRAELESDKDRLDRDDKHHRWIQDHDLKKDSGIRSKEYEGRTDVHKAGAKHANDPTKVPQPRSYFQHDDRGRAGRNGRSFGRKTESEHRRGELMEQQSDRTINRTASVNMHRRDEMVKDSRDDSHVWRHDAYFELEANPKPPPTQKRRSFREQKFHADPETKDKPLADPWMPKAQAHAGESGNRDERGRMPSRHSGRPERAFAGDRDLNKAHESWRGSFQPHDRASAGSGYRGKDRFIPRQVHHPSPGGGHVEKWKHDLYDEANRSPTPKNEEDQISKIEALLAS